MLYLVSSGLILEIKTTIRLIFESFFSLLLSLMCLSYAFFEAVLIQSRKSLQLGYHITARPRATI